MSLMHFQKFHSFLWYFWNRCHKIIMLHTALSRSTNILHYNENFYNYLKSLIDSDEQINMNKIKQLKMKQKRSWPKGQRIYFSDIQNDSRFREAIFQLSKVEKQKTMFYTWNSDLNELFFETLSRTSWTIKIFVFANCSIDNNLSRCLSFYSKYKQIQDIRIADSRIGNKGMKLLLKLDFQNLLSIGYQKTHITNDCVNLFEKNKNSFYQIMLHYSDFGLSLLLLKRANTIFRLNSGLLFLHPDPEKNNHSFYLPFLAKLNIQINSNFFQREEIPRASKLEFLRKESLFSIKTIDKLFEIFFRK